MEDKKGLIGVVLIALIGALLVFGGGLVAVGGGGAAWYYLTGTEPPPEVPVTPEPAKEAPKPEAKVEEPAAPEPEPVVEEPADPKKPLKRSAKPAATVAAPPPPRRTEQRRHRHHRGQAGRLPAGEGRSALRRPEDRPAWDLRDHRGMGHRTDARIGHDHRTGHRDAGEVLAVVG